MIKRAISKHVKRTRFITIQMHRILLVDDNPDDIFLIKLAIKELNLVAEIETINDGKKAIESLERNKLNKKEELPELILLDINLPKITGLDVLKAIKSNKHTSNIKTVMFTSSDAETDMKTSLEYGADMFFKKPNSINALKEIIQQITENLLVKFS